MPTYNVLHEPWIVVEDLEGAERYLGILDVLEQAHQLRRVVEPAPPIQCGMYRLLLALVMDALDLQEIEDLGALLEDGQIPMTKLHQYIERVSPSRFDLFDEKTPFLQMPAVGAEDGETKSVAELFFHLPTGTNVTHFHHVQANEQAIAPDVCARALCAVAPFMTAGGAGYSPSINGTPPWYVFVKGTTLFETLVLNIYLATTQGMGRGMPAWRQDEAVVPKAPRTCDGLLAGLTWQPREIRLLPGEGGFCTYSGMSASVLVRRIHYGPGAKYDGVNWTDPQVAYKTTEKGRMSIRPQEGRALWRDAGALFLLRQGDYSGDKGKVRFARPAVVDQLRVLRNEWDWTPASASLIFEAYGMRVDKAKVFEWQYDQIGLPDALLDRPRVAERVQQALDLSETISYYLARALKKAYPRNGGGNASALGRLISRSQTTYWNILRDAFMDEFLWTLSAKGVDDPESMQSLLGEWGNRCKEVGLQVVQDAVGPLDANAAALARQQDVLTTFRVSVYRLLHADSLGAKKVKKSKKKGDAT